MQFRLDDLTGERVVALILEHLEDMRRVTPPESVHALDLDELKAKEVTFWSAWDQGELLGCGALKSLGGRRGEIKTMRTVRTRRRLGVGSAMLAHIEREALRREYRELLLETGSQPEFAGARAFYERHGYGYRGPFADYAKDANSVFMAKALTL